MRTRTQRGTLDRAASSRRVTHNSRSSSIDYEERLNLVRNEVHGELLRSRLMNFIKYEHELEAAASSLRRKTAAAKEEQVINDSFNMTDLSVRRYEPIPAFPPVEASVDLGWYLYEDVILPEHKDQEELLETSELPGIQLILTPLKYPESDSGSLESETPRLDSGPVKVEPGFSKDVVTAVVQRKRENRLVYPEVVFLDDDDDSTSCETLSSESESEYE